MPFPNKDTQFPTGEKQVETARQGGKREMKSCIYCQHIDEPNNDELYDTRKVFIERLQTKGTGINIPIKEGNLIGEMNISLDIILECDKNEPTLNCYLWEAYDGDDIFNEGIKINYCPMCGRKFNGK